MQSVVRVLRGGAGIRMPSPVGFLSSRGHDACIHGGIFARSARLTVITPITAYTFSTDNLLDTRAHATRDSDRTTLHASFLLPKPNQFLNHIDPPRSPFRSTVLTTNSRRCFCETCVIVPSVYMSLPDRDFTPPPMCDLKFKLERLRSVLRIRRE